MSSTVLACPFHGKRPSTEAKCQECGRKPYDLSNTDDRDTFRSLRTTAYAARMNIARGVAVVPAAVVGLFLLAVLSGNDGNVPKIVWKVLGFVVTTAVWAGSAFLIERALRARLPRALRELDDVVLSGKTMSFIDIAKER